ncbi:hypothetical protein NCS56_00088900 [Fusarium sp. Ph1]|nr:hypothetical protein NCS56_00088900 [Fusarium sp. Ph1]
MEESTPSPETAAGPGDKNDSEENEQAELYHTTTSPEFLQWRKQVQAKLSILEQNIDPLVARHQYNLENSRIYSIPEEILVMAMRFLNDEDAAALFSFQKNPFSRYDRCMKCDLCKRDSGEHFGIRRHCFEVKARDRSDVPPAELDEAASRLRRDLLCVNCQRGYTNRKKHGLSVACKFSTYEGDNQWLHCSGCKVDHLSTVFSTEEAKKPCNERLCIGRQGYVRLCEHEVITWADIEARVNQALRESIGSLDVTINFRRCQHQNPELGRKLNREVCDHHNILMSISAAPEVSELSVSLGLCWMVEFEHATTQTTGDSEPLSAEELKVMAQALRLGGAASIIPAEGPSHLPEMDCFSASWDCHRFRLWPRVLEEHPTPQTSIRLLPEDRCVSKHTGTDVPCTGLHTATTMSSSTSAGLTITAPRGLPIVPEDGLNFNYSKFILANDKKTDVYDNDGVTLTPSHSWYHAMDRNSYSWEGGCGALESCQNPFCRNHYSLVAESSHCRPGISRNCKCELESADGEDQGEEYDTE